MIAHAAGVGWFDQAHAHELFLAKGILALLATLLVVGHMIGTWRGVTSLGQRLRYGALFYFAANITFASAEQVNEPGLLVEYRHLTSIVGVAVCILAMLLSIHEDHRKSKRRRADRRAHLSTPLGATPR